MQTHLSLSTNLCTQLLSWACLGLLILQQEIGNFQRGLYSALRAVSWQSIDWSILNCEVPFPPKFVVYICFLKPLKFRIEYFHIKHIISSLSSHMKQWKLSKLLVCYESGIALLEFILFFLVCLGSWYCLVETTWLEILGKKNSFWKILMGGVTPILTIANI